MKKIGRVFRESIATHIKEGIDKQDSIFLVNYSKVSSIQMDNLRKNLRKVGARLYVSKNSIAKKTLRDLKFDKLVDWFDGQTAFIWGAKDSLEVSKALTKFAKECEGIRVRGGLLQGRILEKEDVKRLSDLPSREILLAQFLGTFQSPVIRLMGALNGKAQELMSILKQLSEKK